MGQWHAHGSAQRVSQADLLALVCCDLGAITRGRSILAAELSQHLDEGVSWVPANHALTPLGPLAEPNPFGSTGDLRLLPDQSTHVRVGGGPGETPLELLLCDILTPDGRPWECCTRTFLKDALNDLHVQTGANLLSSFEHEFQLLSDEAPALPFSLEAQRRAEPFAGAVIGALVEAGAEPERFFPEYGGHQFEIPVAASIGLAGADRSVILREVVREVARRHDLRASFVPLLDPAGPGNGVHIHISLLDQSGRPLFYDPQRPGCLSELAGSFAAGVLEHAGALSAICAPSPISAARLRPHHWSAGALCLAQENREALLRVPALVTLGGADPAGQLRLEYRGADSAANPYLALGAILRAGLGGIRKKLPCPPILDRDPAELDAEQAERFSVGGLPESLGQSLQALEADATARAWLPPLLGEAYLSLKRAELAATEQLDPKESCRRYAAVY